MKTHVIPQSKQEFDDIVRFLKTEEFPNNITTPQKKHNFRRRCKCFSVVNDILFLETGGIKRRVVPEFDHELRMHLLKKFHSDKHFEYQKTFNMLYEQYVGIKKVQVKEFVDQCERCSINARKNIIISGSESFESIVAFKPWDYVLIDVLDFSSLSNENEGLSYVLIIMDVFSKFVFSFAMLGNDALEVTNNLFNVCLKEGIPRVIHGMPSQSSLVQEVVDELSKLFKVDCIVQGSCPRISSDLNQVERLKSTVGKTFTKLLWDKDNHLIHNRWIDTLPAATFGYNLTLHPVIYITPFKAFRGREPNNMDQLKRNGRKSTSNLNDGGFIISDFAEEQELLLQNALTVVDEDRDKLMNMETDSAISASNGGSSSTSISNVASPIIGSPKKRRFDDDAADINNDNLNQMILSQPKIQEKNAGNYPFDLNRDNFELVFKELQKTQNAINHRVAKKTGIHHESKLKKNADDLAKRQAATANRMTSSNMHNHHHHLNHNHLNHLNHVNHQMNNSNPYMRQPQPQQPPFMMADNIVPSYSNSTLGVRSDGLNMPLLSHNGVVSNNDNNGAPQSQVNRQLLEILQGNQMQNQMPMSQAQSIYDLSSQSSEQQKQKQHYQQQQSQQQNQQQSHQELLIQSSNRASPVLSISNSNSNIFSPSIYESNFNTKAIIGGGAGGNGNSSMYINNNNNSSSSSSVNGNYGGNISGSSSMPLTRFPAQTFSNNNVGSVGSVGVGLISNSKSPIMHHSHQSLNDNGKNISSTLQMIDEEHFSRTLMSHLNAVAGENVATSSLVSVVVEDEDEDVEN